MSLPVHDFRPFYYIAAGIPWILNIFCVRKTYEGDRRTISRGFLFFDPTMNLSKYLFPLLNIRQSRVFNVTIFLKDIQRWHVVSSHQIGAL